MHELSLAANIIEQVNEVAKSNGARVVTKIELVVGEASGVHLEALEAGMHLAMKNSLMDNAEMVINRVKTKLQCSDCKYTFNPGCDDTIFMPCPRCGFFTSVIEGKEFKINSIDIK